MDEKFFDLQVARNLFSKAQKVTFGFLNSAEKKHPFVSLHFKPDENKQVHYVSGQLSKALKEEKFRLYVNENGGDYLSVSFLWESRGIIFSSSPDRYNKRECREFRLDVLYGHLVKLFFYLDGEENATIINANTAVNGPECIYYEYTS